MKRFKKIYLEITNMCNKKCYFCSQDNLPKKEMSLIEFEEIIKKIKPYTDYIYLHIKGEPLFHNNFREILNICKKYKININITTNGTFLKKYESSIINNEYIKQINISLQSYDYKQDNIDEILITVGNILNKTKINIVFRFWALKNQKIMIKEKFLINKIVTFFKSDLIVKKDVENKQNIKIKDNLYINKDNIFEWPNLKNSSLKETFCLGLKSHIGILVDGTVIPCCLDSKGIINLGNILKEDLEVILNRERTKAIIENFRNNKCYEQLCKECSYRLNNNEML